MKTIFQEVKLSYLTALLTGSIFLGMHTPGLGWYDGGDFVTSASELGVGHPTGFPVYTLIGHLATLVPIGNIAGRLAWFSGITIAIASFFLALLLQIFFAKNQQKPTWLLFAVPISFLAIDSVRIHGLVPEVYAANLAILFAAMYFAHKSKDDFRFLAITSLLLGLGLSHHVLFALWSPILFIAAAWPHRSKPKSIFGSALLGMLVGLSYTYLFVAAKADPLYNWGDPSTLQNLIRHMTGASIRDSFQNEMASGWYPTWVYARTMWNQTSILVQSVMFIGIGSLLIGSIRKNKLVLTTLLIVFSDFAYSILINPMGIADLQCGQASLSLLTISGIVGSILIATKITNKKFAAPWIVTTTIVLLFSLTSRPWSLANDWTADDLITYHLLTAEPESLTSLQSDATTGGFLYAQVILHARQDSAFFGRSLVTYGGWINDWSAQQPFLLAPREQTQAWKENEELFSMENRLASIVASQPITRKIYWEVNATQMEVPDGRTYVSSFPFGTIEPTINQNARWTDIAYSAHPEGLTHLFPLRGPFSDRYLANQHSSRGAIAYRAGQYELAMRHFAIAVELAPLRAPNWTNLGVAFAANGDLQNALDCALTALDHDPLSNVAVQNGLRYANALDDESALLRLSKQAQRLR